MKSLSNLINESIYGKELYKALDRRCSDAQERIDGCPYAKDVVKILGSGTEGVCCLLKNNKVLKIYYKELPVKMQLLGQLYKQGKEFEWLPAIYDFGDYWFVRDYYKTNNIECKWIYKLAMEYIEKGKEHKEIDGLFNELEELCGKGNADLKPDGFG